jgi:hypothetical protein
MITPDWGPLLANYNARSPKWGQQRVYEWMVACGKPFLLGTWSMFWRLHVMYYLHIVKGIFLVCCQKT